MARRKGGTRKRRKAANAKAKPTGKKSARLAPATDARETTVAELASVAERVDHIAALMRSFEWETGRTYKELAKLWDVSPSTVRDYSSEASRRVRSEVTNPEEVSRDVCLSLREAVTACRVKKDWTRMTKAAEAWATISGAKAAERVDMRSVTAEATPEEARRIMAEKFGRLVPPPISESPSEDAAPASQ